jgi:hypothetical protein
MAFFGRKVGRYLQKLQELEKWKKSEIVACRFKIQL